MSNKEQYKKAFSVLKTSGDFSLEDEKMAKLKKKVVVRRMIAAAAACLIIVGGSGTAYAANIGGIQQTIKMWFHGNQTDVNINFDDEGSYSYEFVDENGEHHEGGGGGIAIEPDGEERPLTPEEMMDDFGNTLDIEYADDGTVTLYYQDQIIDITDKFENGYAHILLNDEKGNLYVTVKYDEGWGTDREKFPDVD